MVLNVFTLVYSKKAINVSIFIDNEMDPVGICLDMDPDLFTHLRAVLDGFCPGHNYNNNKKLNQTLHYFFVSNNF
jgi:predicted transcriptional regulator YheO